MSNQGRNLFRRRPSGLLAIALCLSGICLLGARDRRADLRVPSAARPTAVQAKQAVQASYVAEREGPSAGTPSARTSSDRSVARDTVTTATATVLDTAVTATATALDTAVTTAATASDTLTSALSAAQDSALAAVVAALDTALIATPATFDTLTTALDTLISAPTTVRDSVATTAAAALDAVIPATADSLHSPATTPPAPLPGTAAIALPDGLPTSDQEGLLGPLPADSAVAARPARDPAAVADSIRAARRDSIRTARRDSLRSTFPSVPPSDSLPPASALWADSDTLPQSASNATDSLGRPNRKTRVDLLYASRAWADQEKRPDVQTLVGDVRLRHDSMYMWCDSALIFQQLNSVEAFGSVRMEQGDTLFIFGDYLYYDGSTQIAMLRENVRMINGETVLTTDSLNYDRVFSLGYYFEGGTLTDVDNVLTSFWGEYNTATKLAVFNHDVTLTNPSFVLTSDTLEYSTLTKVATILGPSDIFSDANHIYSERGTYDTSTDQAVLLDRSVINSGGRHLTGDSLFYDRQRGYGEAFDHVRMTDPVNRNMLTGHYCFYNELTGGALATRRAVAVDYSQGDSLFLHGDTLRLVTFHLNTDSMYREMRAYHHVRAYRQDVQAVSDSMVYNSKDSCLTMYTDPILWYGEEQLLGEEIKIYMNDSTIDWAHIINQALAVEQKDSIHYNQVSGKEMKAYFIEGDIRQVDVNTNVYVIYYPIDEKDSSLMMLNYSEGSFLQMFLRDRRMDKGRFIGAAEGILYPMDQIPADRYRLPAFVWFDYVRPRNKYDIFQWRGKHESDRLKKSTRQPVASPKSLHIERTKK